MHFCNYLARICACVFFVGYTHLYAFAGNEPEVVLTTGHTDQVSCMAISFDGNYIVSGGLDKNIKIWDVATTKEFLAITGNDRSVSYIATHPSKYIFGALFNNEVFNLYDFDGKIILSVKDVRLSEEFYFSKDGKRVILMGDNMVLRFYDVETGALLTSFETVAAHRFGYDEKHDKIYVVGIDGKMHSYNAADGTGHQEATLFDESIYPVTRLGIDKNGKYVAIAHPNNPNIYVFDTEKQKITQILSGHLIRVRDMAFSRNGEKLYSLDFEGNVISWDIKTGKILKTGKFSALSPSWIEISLTQDILVIAAYKEIWYYDAESFMALKVFKSKAHKILNFSYSKNHEMLASAADDISVKLWDLKQNKIIATLPGFFPCLFSPTQDLLVSMHFTLKLVAYNPKTQEAVKYFDTEGELITNIAFSSDGKLLAGAGWGGVIRVWDVESGKIIMRLKGHEHGIYNMSFHPDNKIMASAGLDNTVRIWDLKKEKLINTLKLHEILISDVQFSPNGELLAASSWDKKISIIETKTWTLQRTLEGHKNVILDVDFSPDGKYLASTGGNGAVGESDNSIIVWDVANGKIVCRLYNPAGQVNKVNFDKQPGYLYSCANDGMIKYWDFTSCKEVAEFMAFNETDYMITTPGMYYMCSKNALQGIAFKLDEKIYSFEQFDMRFNRPDLVMRETRKSSIALINAYEYLYKKRLKKNDCDENFETSYDVPSVEIVKDGINYFVDKQEFNFVVKAKDVEFPLKKVNITVNGVPANVKTITGQNMHEAKLECAVDLMVGQNVIDVVAINENGAESFSDRIEITRTNPLTTQQGKLIVITVGVSAYNQSQFNLAYASKDATDMSNIFRLSKLGFVQKQFETFTDNSFTAANFAKIQHVLETATCDDMVVLFFAGHGILDKEFNYYFCPYDMDFNNPTKVGLSFDEIENALKVCKAYRKLLIMDSCHSGEIDKDEVAVVQNNQTENNGDIKFRSAGMEIELQNEFGLENTQHLIETVFADTKNATGATTITSAGGAEFAIESGEWKNGLFTYCLMRALKTMSADINLNGEISVGELRAKTYTDVKEISKGKQQPTTRSENIVLDFRIW